jgi:AI-2 transport system permease protein
VNKVFTQRVKQFMKSWDFVLLVILILEVLIFGTKNSKFLMPRVLLGSINDIISICIISLFVTFVMVTGGIDIQAGAIVGLTSIIIGVAWQDWAVHFPGF